MPAAIAAISSAAADRRVHAIHAAKPASSSDVQVSAPGGNCWNSGPSAWFSAELKSAPSRSASRSSAA